jgi:hypothetical protein
VVDLLAAMVAYYRLRLKQEQGKGRGDCLREPDLLYQRSGAGLC